MIVVNYNSADGLARCAASLRASREAPLLVVVDNASRTAEGIEEAVADYPAAQVFYSPTNLGFGRGNNLGLRWALRDTDSEFFLLLNNDATVQPDTIGRLEAAMDGHPGAGAAAPRIVLTEDPDALWYGGGDLDWRKGSPAIPGYLGPSDSGLALEPRDVAFASGCAMVIRRPVLERVGGFDPRLFMYQEDLELCLRVRRDGWTIRYVPDALVLHEGQGSGREEGEDFIPILSPRNPRLPFYAFHVTKGRVLTAFVHARGAAAARFLAWFPAYLLYQCGQYVLHRRWDGARAMLSGLWQGVRALRKPFVNELKSS